MPFAPRLHQQRDQLPLRAAGVLEFVDEHVMKTRLEPETALREFVHLPQQADGCAENVAEVEHRTFVQRAPVFRARDREHAPDAPRRTTFKSRLNVRDDAVRPAAPTGGTRRDGGARLRVTGNRLRCRSNPGGALRADVAPRRCAARRSRSPRTAAETGTVAVPAGRISEVLHGRFGAAAPERGAGSADATAGPFPGSAPGRRRTDREHSRRPTPGAAGTTIVSVVRSEGRFGEETLQRRPTRRGAARAAREPLARRDIPSCASTSPRPCRASPRDENPERSVQRLVDEARHFGLVGHRKARIEIRFERELAEQRQTERVDRADLDVAEAIAELPPRAGSSRPARPRAAGPE